MNHTSAGKLPTQTSGQLEPGPPARDARDLRQAVRGDQHAAARLFDRYAPSVKAIAWRMLGTHEDAEDVVQDVFMKFWKALANLDRDAVPVRPWLLRVTANLSIDRTRKRREALSDDGSVPDMSDQRVTPEAALANAQLAGAVDRAIANLPARQRLAVILTAREQLSQKEAADAMDLNVKALESLLSRARAKLRVALAETASLYLGTTLAVSGQPASGEHHEEN